MRLSLILCLALLLSCAPRNLHPDAVHMPERLPDPSPLFLELSNAAQIEAIQALPPPVDGFSFLVLGDNRDGDRQFNRLVRRVNSYSESREGPERPRFVLHVGDMVPNGRLDEWQRYRFMRAALRLPVVHVRGNHEIIAADGAANYAQLVGPPEWFFDWAGARFIGIDNAQRRFTQPSIDYLAQALSSLGQSATDPAPWTFVVFHIPLHVEPWRVHSVNSDAEGGRDGEVMELISNARVDAVFMGHLHLHDVMEIGGVPYIISGGAGSPLASRRGFGLPEFGFVHVRVGSAGVSWEWVPLDR